MGVPKIKFSENWSKLQEPLFTTIRGLSPRYPKKAEYYREQIGRTFDVVLNKGEGLHAEPVCKAILLDVLRVEPSKISHFLLDYDTDGNEEYMEKIRAYKEVLILIYRRVN